jgi:hypothetical protein
MGQETKKSKQQKEAMHAPARPRTGFQRTIDAHVARPRHLSLVPKFAELQKVKMDPQL